MAMKRRILPLLLLTLALAAAPALAAPQLGGVTTEGVSLVTGQDGWYFEFSTSEGGTLEMELLSGETGEQLGSLGAAYVEAGTGRIEWNGLMPDGTPVAPGEYLIAVRVRNFWGEESERLAFSLHIFASEAERDENVLDIAGMEFEEAQTWDEGDAMTEAESADARQETQAAAQETADADAQSAAETADAQITAVPVATSFWDMDPDAYDLTDPAHQQAIWDLMMQPITVLDVDQVEHVYPTKQPGTSYKPYEENCAGEIHGSTQGVHVLEEDTDGDGYVLVEAYSNNGAGLDSDYMIGLNAKLIRGYVKTSLLKTVEPSRKIALLVDKLRQKMYIFEDGRITGELLVSTGLNTEDEVFNETGAGDFLTANFVGDFPSGPHTLGKYAIRFSGGNLLHEVLHEELADGTRVYDKFEPQLGSKASHGCVRVQYRANEAGQNMKWIWDNIEKGTRLFMWDDQGRMMYEPEIPDPSTPLYRNPNGGSNYHLDQNCSGVRSKYLPLTGDFTYGDLDEDEFKNLTPCRTCGAPLRLEELYEQYVAAAEQIGAEIPADALAKFGK